jgi:MFS family permease
MLKYLRPSVALPPAFQYRDFTLFWTGATLSQVGSQLTVVAMAWQIYELTDSPLQIGLLGLGRAIPQIALALVGGVLADAMDRRRLMMVIQVGQLGVSIALTALTIVGAITPSMLFAAAFVLAFGNALENPPRQAIVPNLVPESVLSSAIALNTIQRSVGLILGPSAAGVLLALSGPEICYGIDAATWVVMLVALALVRARPIERKLALSVTALLAGARFVLRQRVIFSFMVLDFGATFFGNGNALYPIFARDILDVGELGLGFMYAAPAVGAVVSGVIMSSRPQPRDAGKWVIIGVVFYGACTALFALLDVFWLILLLLAGTGVGNTVSSVLRGTTNQLLTPDELRGRVSAVNSAFVIGGPMLGQFRGGLFADLWGAPASGALGGLGAMLCAVAIGLVPGVWRFRLDPGGPPPEEVAPATETAPAAGEARRAR